MKIASRFTMAVHALLCIDFFSDAERVTSEFVARSVNVNSVTIRQIMQKLKASGLVTVERGIGGTHLAKPAEDITLYDVYLAVDAVDGSVFGFHEAPNKDCPIGICVEPILKEKLDEAQCAMEKVLGETTLAELAIQVNGCGAVGDS